MQLLEQRILSEGKVKPGGILKVDSFLNHQLDPELLFEMARELRRLYEGAGVNKILTIEASGIALAILTGYVFGCPVVFAKKSKTKNISDALYSVEVPSFTHGNVSTVVVSKEYLGAQDRVLIVDDFLATGAALVGLKALVGQAVPLRVGLPPISTEVTGLTEGQALKVWTAAAVTKRADGTETTWYLVCTEEKELGWVPAETLTPPAQ